MNTTDPLSENAKLLVPTANIHALGLHKSLMIEYDGFIDLMEEIDLGRWDFIVTVGIVFLAATRLRNIGRLKSIVVNG